MNPLRMKAGPLHKKIKEILPKIIPAPILSPIPLPIPAGGAGAVSQIIYRTKVPKMAIALLAALALVTVAGAVLVTMLLLSNQANIETKAGILVVFLLQVIKMIYDQFITNQADAHRLRLEETMHEVKTSSDEAVGTARADLISYIKSDDLLELDALADGFAKKKLDLPQSERFLALLHVRLQDDITPIQRGKVLRAIEIITREIANPSTAQRPPATQTTQETHESKETQAGHEDQQRERGTRKETIPGGNASIPPAGVSTPRVVAAVEAAAASAQETQRLTEKSQAIVEQAAQKVAKE